jgi:hypothetical protein
MEELLITLNEFQQWSKKKNMKEDVVDQQSQRIKHFLKVLYILLAAKISKLQKKEPSILIRCVN